MKNTISSRQLRQLIQEEFDKVKHKLVEDRSALDNDFALNLVEKLVDGLTEHWHMLYDEGDPSMSALGEKAWMAQSFAAGEELRNSICDLINDVESKLIGGEFHTGEGPLHHTAFGKPAPHHGPSFSDSVTSPRKPK